MKEMENMASETDMAGETDKEMAQQEADAPEAKAAPEAKTNETQGAQAEAEAHTEGDAAEQAASEAVDAPAEPSPEEKLAEANDQIMRLLAELENTRRRGERDRGDALKYGAASFARDMLGVADNLQRALKAFEEIGEELPEQARALLEGVAATERDLQAALTRNKVSPISPMGEKFDPNLHEALFEAPGTGQPAGTIIEVVETGYIMEERLLRPAKVGIAKD
ncbi:MAG: nucleotide exchange factor GrpE [Parvibaculales bacterium]